MADNKESFQESIMIRRAKIRLFGAIIILILLFVLSIFFLKDRTNINLKDPIKISFLEKSNDIIIGSNIVKSKNLSKIATNEVAKLLKKKKSQNFSDNDRSYFIQIGIFSDEINASRLLGKIKSMGYEARLEMIKMSGKEKLRLSTTVFNSKIEAQTALTILRGENLPGMIKRE